MIERSEARAGSAAAISSSSRPGAPSSEDWRTWDQVVGELATRYAPDAEAADEMHQLAMLRLQRLWSRVRELPAWATVVLRRLAGRIRRERALERAALVGLEAAALSCAPTAETEVAVAETLQALPPLHRGILELHIQGSSHVEIAAALGCPVNQVGARLARAHRAARGVRDRSAETPTPRRSSPGALARPRGARSRGAGKEPARRSPRARARSKPESAAEPSAPE